MSATLGVAVELDVRSLSIFVARVLGRVRADARGMSDCARLREVENAIALSRRLAKQFGELVPNPQWNRLLTNT